MKPFDQLTELKTGQNHKNAPAEEVEEIGAADVAVCWPLAAIDHN